METMKATVFQHSPHQDGDGEPDENNDEERPEGITEKGIRKPALGFANSDCYVVTAVISTRHYLLPLREPNPRPQSRTMTVIYYKGYRIEISSVGKGWRASIFSPGLTTPWRNSPANLEKSSTEDIVAEAKRIIEVHLGPRTL